jgi:hypothetical protein
MPEQQSPAQMARRGRDAISAQAVQEIFAQHLPKSGRRPSPERGRELAELFDRIAVELKSDEPMRRRERLLRGADQLRWLIAHYREIAPESRDPDVRLLFKIDKVLERHSTIVPVLLEDEEEVNHAGAPARFPHQYASRLADIVAAELRSLGYRSTAKRQEASLTTLICVDLIQAIFGSAIGPSGFAKAMKRAGAKAPTPKWLLSRREWSLDEITQRFTGLPNKAERILAYIEAEQGAGVPPGQRRVVDISAFLPRVASSARTMVEHTKRLRFNFDDGSTADIPPGFYLVPTGVLQNKALPVGVRVHAVATEVHLLVG